jgi:hypothetical protein
MIPEDPIDAKRWPKGTMMEQPEVGQGAREDPHASSGPPQAAQTGDGPWVDDPENCDTCAERPRTALGILQEPEAMPLGECPLSKRRCGHHCNCTWTQDACCWCGFQLLGDGQVGWDLSELWQRLIDHRVRAYTAQSTPADDFYRKLREYVIAENHREAKTAEQETAGDPLLEFYDDGLDDVDRNIRDYGEDPRWDMPERS